MPDVVVIFCDGSVRREESGFCNIDQSSAAPVLLVSSVISHCLLFTDYIGNPEESGTSLCRSAHSGDVSGVLHHRRKAFPYL